MKSFLGWLLVVGLATGGAMRAEVPPLLLPPHPFVEQMEHWMRDGGEWRCDNPDYKEGTDQAKEFGCKFAWSLHKRTVTLGIFGDYPDGNRITCWHHLLARHPGEHRVVMTHLGVGGAVLPGHELMPDEPTREHVFEGVKPDGSEFKFHDIARITGPDSHEATSFPWKDDEWVEPRKLTRRRVKVAALQ